MIAGKEIKFYQIKENEENGLMRAKIRKDENNRGWIKETWSNFYVLLICSI